MFGGVLGAVAGRETFVVEVWRRARRWRCVRRCVRVLGAGRCVRRCVGAGVWRRARRWLCRLRCVARRAGVGRGVRVLGLAVCLSVCSCVRVLGLAVCRRCVRVVRAGGVEVRGHACDSANVARVFNYAAPLFRLGFSIFFKLHVTQPTSMPIPQTSLILANDVAFM